MVLLFGENGQGKSNLLEALYMLAIAKSHRASGDRELVRWRQTGDLLHAQVAAVAEHDSGSVRVQIDFRSSSARGALEDNGTGDVPAVDKYVRVNGVPRRSSDLVGEVTAVLFTAQDLDIVIGPPTARRRYLDILVSQVDRRYLKSLQKYQRVVYQRNHLLKSIGAGRSKPSELDFWDDELVAEGAYIMDRRSEAISALSEAAGPIHRGLTGTEQLDLAYAPSAAPEPSYQDAAGGLRRTLDAQRDREIASGFTTVGPHRDDLQMLLDGMDAGQFASRGQCRTLVLAMKLAEARYLKEQRGREPVLLLDDVLSELDSSRREHVLGTVEQFRQSLITTSDRSSVPETFRSRTAMFAVRDGGVELEAAGPA